MRLPKQKMTYYYYALTNRKNKYIKKAIIYLFAPSAILSHKKHLMEIMKTKILKLNMKLYFFYFLIF